MMVLFQVHQRFKGYFLNESRVSFKVFLFSFKLPKINLNVNEY